MLEDKIKSLREGFGVDYYKPPVEKLKERSVALRNSPVAQEYLARRGLTQETIDHFQLGYDAERNAIAIPVFKRGELINVKYRLLEPQGAKYTQEKDAEIYLYNEDGIKLGMEKKGILIVEGEFDLMMCWQNGLKNVISPASGKDSFGIWLEQLDKIPRVFIAYDNDKGGKESAAKMAERLGEEKCQEVLYPEGIKDANDFFLSGKGEQDYRELIKSARPFYTYKFKDMVDVVNELRSDKGERLELYHMPGVKMKKDWVGVISGRSNVGKTSYIMNLVEELSEKKIPSLILPFERGILEVGTRYLQVMNDMTEDQLRNLPDDEWQGIIRKLIDKPVYYALPTKDEAFDIIRKAKRMFDIKVVVIDHLDLMVRSTKNDYMRELALTIQELKKLAQEQEVIVLCVHHINKDDKNAKKNRRLFMEDLKGSSALYQDPEFVIMLTSDNPQDATQLNVDVVKNKGKMFYKGFRYNTDTGKLFEEVPIAESAVDKEFNDF